jgi:hypothetical protein
MCFYDPNIHTLTHTRSMTTIGYGGIVPETLGEKVFASVYILFATSTYLLLVWSV